MKTPEKYDPEDIESLMLHKQFSELYPEEKEFVLRHLESEEEYTSMRLMMIELKDIVREEGQETPDKRIKAALLKEFNSGEKKSIVVWLNSLFISPTPMYRRPAFYGMAAVFIGVIGFVFFFNSNDSTRAQLADNVSSKDSLTPQALPDSSANTFVEIPKVDTSNASVLPKPVVKLAMAKTVNLENSYSTVADNASPLEENAPSNIQMGDESESLSKTYAEQAIVSTSAGEIQSKSALSKAKDLKELESVSDNIVTSSVSTSSSMKQSKISLEKLFTAR